MGPLMHNYKLILIQRSSPRNVAHRCTLFRDVSITETDAGRHKIKEVLPSGNTLNQSFKAGKNTS